MASVDPYVELVVAVIAIAIVVPVAVYLLRRYRQRRLQAIHGEGTDPHVASDRAYNRLALARREASLWEAQGGDTEQARQLITLAGRSLDAQEFDRAYSLAQAAHETLVKARQGPLPTGAATAPASPAGTTAAGSAAGGPPRPSEGEKNPATVKSQVEAQFQLRLFEQDLVSAGKGAPGTQAEEGARTLYVQAHAAFDRGDYPEAFRLALRGRRQVGGRVETLGPPAPSPAPSGNGSPSAAPEATAEAVASQERCPVCGHPTTPGEKFCRGCGAARSTPSCPMCGAARVTGDAFCGKCGARYP